MVREVLLCFVFALVVGSLINGYKPSAGDNMGTTTSSATGTATQAEGGLPSVNEANFQEEVVNSATPVFVDFYTDWCGPCKEMAPIVADLAGQFKGTVKFVRVNGDTSPKLVERYQAEGYPTFMMFKNGEKVDMVAGTRPRSALFSFIQKYVDSDTSTGQPAAPVLRSSAGEQQG